MKYPPPYELFAPGYPCGPSPNSADGGQTDDLFGSRKKRLVRLYQLDRPSLEIDHCSISRVALQLHSTGEWVLSLRGDQNPRQEGPELTYQPRLHLKRNQFVVRIRGYGSFAEEPTPAAVASGKPELVDLQTIEFWVQNGEPRYLRQWGHDHRIAEFFDLIDRIEIEFFYR